MRKSFIVLRFWNLRCTYKLRIFKREIVFVIEKAINDNHTRVGNKTLIGDKLIKMVKLLHSLYSKFNFWLLTIVINHKTKLSSFKAAFPGTS